MARMKMTKKMGKSENLDRWVFRFQRCRELSDLGAVCCRRMRRVRLDLRADQKWESEVEDYFHRQGPDHLKP